MTIYGTALLSSGSLVDLDATYFIQLGIFLFMLIVLRKLLFQPLVRLIEARRQATEGAMETARNLNEEAARLNGEAEARLREVRASVKTQREQMVNEARSEERTILSKAREDAHSLLTTMRTETEKAATEARDRLQGQVESLAETVAAKVLDRKL